MSRSFVAPRGHSLRSEVWSGDSARRSARLCAGQTKPGTTPRGQSLPRRLLLAGGWSATAMVAMMGLAACRALGTAVSSGAGGGVEGIEAWVFALFYGSWLVWAILADAATRSYRLRSAGLRLFSPT